MSSAVAGFYLERTKFGSWSVCAVGTYYYHFGYSVATGGRSVSDFVEQFGSGCSSKTTGLIMGYDGHYSTITAASIAPC